MGVEDKAKVGVVIMQGNKAQVYFQDMEVNNVFSSI